MAQQNINQYNFKKWYIKPIQSTFDISLASDGTDYQDEVLFSNKIILEFLKKKVYNIS